MGRAASNRETPARAYARSLEVLGSFDPLALMLEFSGQYHPDGTSDPQEDFLSRVPTGVLVHEITHLTQTLGTAAGIREFLMAIDDMRLRRAMVQTAVKASPDGVLKLPLATTHGLYGDDVAYRELEASWSQVVHTRLVHAGGTYHHEPDPEIELAWLAEDTRITGREVSWEVPFFYLYPFIGVSESVALGFIHLTEGVAKTIERLQRRLTGEPGEFSAVGVRTVTHEQFIQEISSPVDPYYLALLVFVNAKQRFNPAVDLPAYEEYVPVLADIAMMFDPVLTPESFTRVYGLRNDEALDGAINGFSPASLYMRLCRLFWEGAASLPRLDTGRRMTEVVVELQDAFLGQIAPGLTMLSVTRECAETVERLSSHLDSHILDVENTAVRDMFRGAFTRVLAFRADALRGGAISEDLLTDRERLVGFARFLSPSFAVGSTIVSGFETRPGFGIGVDQANLQADRDLLDTLFFGNGPCHLAAGRRERRCPLEPVSLCTELPLTLLETSGPAYCVRDQTLRLLRAMGATDIAWVARHAA